MEVQGMLSVYNSFINHTYSLLHCTLWGDLTLLR